MPGLKALWERKSRRAVTGTGRLLVVPLLLALPAFAQKDFLSPNEIDQVREVQEPVARIKLYLGFAKQRLDQLQSTVTKNRAGRSGEIRQLLEDYTSILDAINTVSDDALARKIDVTLAPEAIVDGEKKFLDQLEKFEASVPRDLDMYQFSLKEAIASTSDSIDLANEDLGFRSQGVANKLRQEQKAVAEVNAAESRKGPATGADASAAEAKAAADDVSKPARKPPTLYRPGEKPDAQ